MVDQVLREHKVTGVCANGGGSQLVGWSAFCHLLKLRAI